VLLGPDIRSYANTCPGLRAALEQLASTGARGGPADRSRARSRRPRRVAATVLLPAAPHAARCPCACGAPGRQPAGHLTPGLASFASTCREVASDRRYVLSRFAYTRREGGETLLDRPWRTPGSSCTTGVQQRWCICWAIPAGRRLGELVPGLRPRPRTSYSPCWPTAP